MSCTLLLSNIKDINSKDFYNFISYYIVVYDSINTIDPQIFSQHRGH